MEGWVVGKSQFDTSRVEVLQGTRSREDGLGLGGGTPSESVDLHSSYWRRKSGRWGPDRRSLSDGVLGV